MGVNQKFDYFSNPTIFRLLTATDGEGDWNNSCHLAAKWYSAETFSFRSRKDHVRAGVQKI